MPGTCHRPCGRDLQPYGPASLGRTVDDVNDSTAVEQLRALADPVRLSIVRELHGGTRCACELARIAAVSPSLLSHHLKVLRRAGLVTGQRRGRWIDYTLDERAFGVLVAQLESPALRGERITMLGCAS